MLKRLEKATKALGIQENTPKNQEEIVVLPGGYSPFPGGFLLRNPNFHPNSPLITRNKITGELKAVDYTIPSQLLEEENDRAYDFKSC